MARFRSCRCQRAKHLVTRLGERFECCGRFGRRWQLAAAGTTAGATGRSLRNDSEWEFFCHCIRDQRFRPGDGEAIDRRTPRATLALSMTSVRTWRSRLALPGFNGALAFGVSNTGYVVGSSMLNQGSGLPFIWSDQGGMVAIPLASGTSQGSARAVNSAGGWWETIRQLSRFRFFTTEQTPIALPISSLRTQAGTYQ